jgi:predicted LPLAT superfamily acyltransferase
VRERLIGGPGGCILLAAHVGNWEVSGLRLSQLLTKRLHVVMVRNDIPSVQQFTDQHMRGNQIAVIDPRDRLGASLAIHAALAKGDVVCMLGDRIIPGQPWVDVDFLGGRARFPVGPFHVAAVTGAPIVVCFLMKTGLRQYRIEVDSPWSVPLQPRGAVRQAHLQHAVQRWATRLERQVQRYPLQWHNFFEFWSAKPGLQKRTSIS